MGYTMRMLDFRYTMWLKYNMSTCRPLPALFSEELYSHRRRKSDGSEVGPHERQLDPLSSNMELFNIAQDPNASKPFNIRGIRKFLYHFLINGSFFDFPCLTS